MHLLLIEWGGPRLGGTGRVRLWKDFLMERQQSWVCIRPFFQVPHDASTP